ncbi:MAG: hypothetical protein RPU42_11160 [Candidatus Sedimenticola sp. (ex Thyasira tokunagai)]
MSVWDTVTGNSSLPVAPGNTFFDHLTNQEGGGTIYVGPLLSANTIHDATADVTDDLGANVQIDILSADVGSDLSANIQNQTMLEADVCLS